MIKDIPALVAYTSLSLKATCDAAVVGMSGGADSTLVALLCRQAFGRNVYSVHMPYDDRDHTFFNNRSVKTATKLGVHILRAPVKNIADEINETVQEAVADFLASDPVKSERPDLSDVFSKVNAGNARSRARMTLLYGVCHHLNDYLKVRVRVIGTGNLSEDYIGYDTKGGDALCDFFPIGRLFKSEVYQLLDWFRDRGDITDDMIDRVPSAGLWTDQSDEAELGYTYNAMEPAIRRFLNVMADSGAPLDDMETFVLARHLANKHKHEAPPSFDLRRFCD